QAFAERLTAVESGRGTLCLPGGQERSTSTDILPSFAVSLSLAPRPGLRLKAGGGSARPAARGGWLLFASSWCRGTGGGPERAALRYAPHPPDLPHPRS